MDAWRWIVLAALVVIVVAFLVWWEARRRRSRQLREGFGLEYERVVEDTGDRRQAERELLERRERREELDIILLSDGARSRYGAEWRLAQERFVDEPHEAVRDADRLVQQVMAERGYPVDEDFERRAADVSVDHPDVVEHFREGHRLVGAHEAGDGSTESLRQAMVHFRSLFDELLESPRDRQEVR
jgi:hypothetical protein